MADKEGNTVTMANHQVAEDSSTFAARNPLKPVIPARKNKRKKTEAEKVTAAHKRDDNASKKEALQHEVEALRQSHEQAIKDLAEKHGKSALCIRSLVTAATHYKSQRAPNLHNAMMHFKAMELNEDREEGERLKLLEIQAALKDDTELEDLPDDKKEILLQLLEEHRSQNKTGARANNQAAAMDVAKTIERIHEELMNLAERTGVVAFLFATRGHINDEVATVSADCEGALDFFMEMLDLTPNEIARRFELWASSKSKDNGTRMNVLEVMKKESTRTVCSGLNKFLGCKNMGMCYAKYDRDIRARHKVQLRGWPAGVKFGPPSNLQTIEEARSLRDALRSGECAWVAMTQQEQTKLAEELKGSVPKTRKERNDKGRKRGSRKAGKQKEDAREESIDETDSESDEAPPRKRAKRTKKSVAKTLPPRRANEESVDEADSDSDEAPLRKKAKLTKKKSVAGTLPPRQANRSRSVVEDDEDGD